MAFVRFFWPPLRRTSEKNRQAEIYASAFHRHSSEEEEEESDNSASFFSETAFHTGSLEEEFFFWRGIDHLQFGVCDESKENEDPVLWVVVVVGDVAFFWFSSRAAPGRFLANRL